MPEYSSTEELSFSSHEVRESMLRHQVIRARVKSVVSQFPNNIIEKTTIDEENYPRIHHILRTTTPMINIGEDEAPLFASVFTEEFLNGRTSTKKTIFNKQRVDVEYRKSGILYNFGVRIFSTTGQDTGHLEQIDAITGKFDRENETWGDIAEDQDRLEYIGRALPEQLTEPYQNRFTELLNIIGEKR
ncbi:hypothetical protein H0X10_01030 [Candidatus Saccharibacteria bacterium]|nr:hypothetical protein [Candidatus Saccharibacteria bacterium]